MTAAGSARRRRFVPPWPVLLLAAAIVAAVGATVSGPTGTSRTATTASHPGPPLEPGRGGTVTVDVPAVPTTLNPHTVAGHTAATRAVGDAIWPQVFETSPGLVPQLDTSVVQSAEVVGVDPQTVVYQINPKAMWSDGVPITAADFIYAWKAQAGSGVDITGTPDSVWSDLGYRDIASITGSDQGRTVRVVFRTPYADWSGLFNSLLPAQIASQAGWNTGFDRFDPGVLVSGGPWMVQAWIPGKRLVLVRNPDWWGAPPPLHQLVLQAVPSPAAEAAAVVAGQAQVMAPDGFDPAVLAAVSSSPQLLSSTGSGTRLLQLVMNTRRPPLALLDARLGIAHLIGRTSLVTKVAGSLDTNLQPLGDHLMSDLQPGYATDGASYTNADTAAAATLLQSVGFTRSNGVWESGGQPLTLHLVWSKDDPWAVASGPVIADQLRSRGVTVTTEAVPSAQLHDQVLPNGAFDLALVAMSTGPYVSQTERWWVPGAPAGGTSSDWSGLADPQVQQLYQQAMQQLNPARDQAIYQQLDQVLWKNMPALPLFAEPTLVAQTVRLTGVQIDPGGAGILWDAASWAPLVATPKGTAPSTTSSSMPTTTAPAGQQPSKAVPTTRPTGHRAGDKAAAAGTTRPGR